MMPLWIDHDSVTRRFQFGSGREEVTVYVTVALASDKPCAISMCANQIGDDYRGLLRALAEMSTWHLQRGGSLKELATLWRGQRFGPRGTLSPVRDGGAGHMASSVLDGIAWWLMERWPT